MMPDVAGVDDVQSWMRRIVVLFVLAPIVASASAFTASFVPDRLILGELAGAVQRDEMILFPQVGVSGRGLDTFSDCIALTMGLGDTDGGAASIWLRSPTLGSCNGAIASIRDHEAGVGLDGGYEYFRYWHGYTVVSRPLVATVGVAGQRIVLLWSFIGALTVLARRLGRRHGALAPIALLGPFLLTTDTIELARSIPHGVSALVAVVGAWWLHRLSGPPSTASNPTGTGRSDLMVASAAFAVGAGYVFVDLLTTPPGAWALSAGVVALGSAEHLSGRALVRRTALASSAWVVGWVWTWVSKWVIAAAVLGYDRVRETIGGAVEDRVGGERDYIDLSPFTAIEVNVRAWWDHPLTPPVLVGIVVVAVMVARRNDWGATWPTRLVVASPSVVPFLWFEVLRNHSLVHPHFVYRSLGVTAGLVAVALIVAPDSIRGRPAHEQIGQRHDAPVPGQLD